MKTIKRQTHILDASSKSLGRLAVEAANFLRGKNKPHYLPYLDLGDNVIVINTDKLKVTGKKLEQKKYYRHSGYPGGLKIKTMDKILEKDSRQIIKKAVLGMVPSNKLRNQMMKRLKLYHGKEK